MSLRLTIRYKFFGLMLLVGLLPLLAVLTILVEAGSRSRIESSGEGFLSMARARSERAAIIIQKDAELYRAALQEDAAMEYFAQHPAVALSDQERKKLDDAWPEMPDDAPEMRAVLDNPLSRRLREVARTDPHCREVFITDALGQEVAASARTEDFYQADETWWQQTYNGGKGQFLVTPVQFDSSTQTWNIAICFPIYARPYAQADVVGIVKAKLDFTTWMRQVDMGDGQGSEVVMVGPDGVILAGEGVTPLSRRVEEFSFERSHKGNSGWYLAKGAIQAFSLVELVEPAGIADMNLRLPEWYLLVQTPARLVLGPIYRLSIITGVVGLALILIVFGAGLWAASRNLISPLERLRQAADRVAGGDLSHQVTGYRHRFGSGDEIGQLVDNFNRMILAVRASQSALQQASEMKSRFIRIAGHELRTPVSYIIGMADLLMLKSQDSELHESLGKIRNRAQRLDQIITEMFKALPAQTGMVTYSRFSMPQAVDEAATELRPFAEGRRQEIHTIVQGEVPEVMADKDKVHDVLVGLTTNAIKFTPDGGEITITTTMRSSEAIAVSIADQCGGIPHDEMMHLFEPFYGGRNLLEHSSGRYGDQKRGTGLGLTIARHFVKIQNGDIEVVNTKGGCVFTMILPLLSEAPAKSGQDFAI